MNVTKRDCSEDVFDKSKITNAILKAMKNGSGIYKPEVAESIAYEIEQECSDQEEINIYDIEEMVFRKLIDKGEILTARAYEGYKSIRAFQRDNDNTTDKQIEELLNGNNSYWNDENSNKNPRLSTTQRDYMAGIVSTDMTRRFLLPPEIVQAHDEGLIHFHDADYFAQFMHNCDLVNLDDMLQNGTVISETLIEKPHSFSTACNIATQIIAQVASSQYGGQSVSLAHLAPFVDVSRQKIRKKTVAWVEKKYQEILRKPFKYSRNKIVALLQSITGAEQRHYKKCYKMAEQFKNNVNIEDMVENDVLEEIKRGIQTIQYQVVTLMTTNGQAPFLTVFMYLNEAKNEKEKADLALLIEETLNQRYEGVKNEQGVWISPAFPKLIYVLEPDNITEDSKYWYLTKLAAKCSAKRLVPDYISEKVMLESKIDANGDGHCYTCMGCRSFLTPYIDDEGKPKYYGRFNQGVVTINLVDIALSSGGNFDKFWYLFDERTELCHKALRLRHERLLGTSSDVAPILWRYGALSRLEKGETIDKLLYGGYSTISLGYAGLYECVKYMTGCNHSDEGKGEEFGLAVMQALNDKCSEWKEAENIAYSLYGTPLESTTYKFANCLKDRFGQDVFEKLDGFDRNYITNSYHIPVFEEIDPFEKLRIEAKFQKLSPGGAISYIETANMQNNLDAVLEVLKFIYENIMYAELNTKSDYCQVCGYDGEISLIDECGKLIWECPHCHNRDPKKMNVTRRTCGYIGTATNGWNQGRLGDIHDRFVHLDNLISNITKDVRSKV
ncbi:MAG: anaerobic ribonucleoside-triphosphate reductase [Oscillospiraceae bacterium]|nr:anaerobic ribonucleoside-triphosphate reductase [Oscillospiraceae bacterium]